MKLEKIKNLVLGLGKGLSIFSIIVTLLIVFLGFLSEIFLYNDFFDSIKWYGIQKTIRWYLDNKPWWEEIISGEYQNYYEKMYANR